MRNFLCAPVGTGPTSKKGDDHDRVQICGWLRRQQQWIRNKIRRDGTVCEDEIPHRWRALAMAVGNPRVYWLKAWYRSARADDLKNGRI